MDAYDPRVMLKIVPLAYRRDLISSRAVEQACQRNVQFIAISGDRQSDHIPQRRASNLIPPPPAEKHLTTLSLNAVSKFAINTNERVRLLGGTVQTRGDLNEPSP